MTTLPRLYRLLQVLVPAVCWSTSVAPLLQSGLKPVFVDVDPTTFNVTEETLEAAMTPNVKALMAVHVLGNSIDMSALRRFVEKYDLILLEDTCESLGSYAAPWVKDGEVADSQKQALGTFGSFGAYSFYFSHHITSGEGGMVVCQTEQDYNFVRCLRAHGWTRHLTNREEVERSHPTIDSRFLFVNVGFNLRPLEVQGAMLLVQLPKLEPFNAVRRLNMARIQARFDADPRTKQYLRFMKASPGTDPAWFGVSVVLNRGYTHQLESYLKFLDENGIENRPVISGNFTRQPFIRSFLTGDDTVDPHDFPGAEVLHHRGFFIGAHQEELSDDLIARLVDIMLSFPFRERKTVMVTGASGMLGQHVRAEVEKTAVSVATKTGTCILSRDPASGLESEWIFVSRKDADLSSAKDVCALFKRYQPTHVMHLAASLQSLHAMTSQPVEFWLDNVSVNNNVLKTAAEFEAWTGPVKLVSVLSTVMFPQDAQYPVTPQQALQGTLHPAGESYALAKRALAKLSAWYRQEYGLSFSTVLPGNFFGAGGDFDPKTAPLLNALIARAVAAKASGSQEPLSVLGIAETERSVMHASDLARIMIWALQNLDQEEPLLVAGAELPIGSIADLVCKAVGFEHGLRFEGQGAATGPLRRTADTSVFQKMNPSFQCVPLEQSIAEVVQWYRKSTGSH